MIKVFSTNAVRGALTELISGFEGSSGQRVSISYASTDQMMSKLREGASADVLIATAAAIDELIKQGKVNAGSRAEIGSTGVGIAVRRGAAKPEIGSVEALKRTLLSAPSVAWTARGASGMYFATVIERLGIAEQMKERAHVITGGLVGEVLVRGEAELGVQMVSEILAVPGAELVGPLPAELQKVVRFGAGIMTGATGINAAQAFIQFLATPQARAVLKSKGVEPPP
ncbi:MAG TPA: molybdate ABC transporter substrate-binding protein [Burkholderiales bacterium]|nr:molybdate ABC transporter substrate-binding protein [Burkholderiales bacterium]